MEVNLNVFIVKLMVQVNVIQWDVQLKLSIKLVVRSVKVHRRRIKLSLINDCVQMKKISLDVDKPTHRYF